MATGRHPAIRAIVTTERLESVDRRDMKT